MARKKPEKPYVDFPLFPHSNGQWAKKIKGKLRYFGPWSDWKSALDKYLEQKDELQAGREPRDPGMEFWELGELFLTSKRILLDNGELSPRTWMSYSATVQNVIKHLGRNIAIRSISQSDFERLRSGLAKTRGPVSLGNEIQRIRSIFKWAYDAGHLATPARFGPGFRRPQKRVIRRAKNENGQRVFSAHEVRTILYSPLTRPQIRAMTLLGLNCGFGQSDISSLPLSAIQGDWVEFPRPKTEIRRRCPLWPETRAALDVVLETRREPRSPEFGHLVFLTRLGQPWVRVNPDHRAPDDNVSKQFIRLLKDLGIKRPKVSYYALRHTFETVSGDAKDQIATDFVMGHADASMAANYRHWISDDRLLAVVNVVRDWLFPRPLVLPE